MGHFERLVIACKPNGSAIGPEWRDATEPLKTPFHDTTHHNTLIMLRLPSASERAPFDILFRRKSEVDQNTLRL